MTDLMRWVVEWLKKYCSERDIRNHTLDFSGGGRIRVDVDWLVRRPKFQEQRRKVQLLECLIENGAIRRE